MHSYDIYVQITHLERLAEDARFSGSDDAANLIDQAASFLKEAQDLVGTAEQEREDEALSDDDDDFDHAA